MQGRPAICLSRTKQAWTKLSISGTTVRSKPECCFQKEDCTGNASFLSDTVFPILRESPSNPEPLFRFQYCSAILEPWLSAPASFTTKTSTFHVASGIMASLSLITNFWFGFLLQMLYKWTVEWWKWRLALKDCYRRTERDSCPSSFCAWHTIAATEQSCHQLWAQSIWSCRCGTGIEGPESGWSPGFHPQQTQRTDSVVAVD